MDLAHLAERVEPDAPRPNLDAPLIIYWMRMATRARENPALDVALKMGEVLKKPVFVYQGLSSRYRYASDRHHTFILEGARDAHRGLRERGIGAVFNLAEGAQAERHLEVLAAQAALVVTDFMPVEPFLRWDATVARRAPLWRVDASCLVPVWRFSSSIDRAGAFRDEAQPLWRERLERPWEDVEPTSSEFLPELPFTPIDLETADLAALVARCDIDHSVSPVHHTRGGTSAGLARWERFVGGALGRYHTTRHNPLADGTSRMSAYLHHGHVSPFRLARDAAAHRTDGAAAFLEQMLTWRELAWHFCWHHPEHETVEALPAWALKTLAEHESDRREYLPSWEHLARAQTGDGLWDAAQRSLLMHGELHNSARMTWGKALIPWTRTAREALTTLTDLNHRFALDGRDPSSAAGLLWCLGAMDRPFSPEQPYFGAVRPSSTAERAKRFDVGEYAARTRRPSRGRALTVAVIGGGVAGLSCARALVDAGQVVTVFEREEVLGGRLAALEEGGASFDLGAPFFTVADERFARPARAWWHERVVTEWRPKVLAPDGERLPPLAVRLVATPSMRSLLQRMAYDIEVRLGVAVASMTRVEDRWRLVSSGGEALGEFEAVVVAVPAGSAGDVVEPLSNALAARLRAVKTSPCWTVAATFPAQLGVDFDVVTSATGALAFATRESSKPERAPGERWVLYSSAEFGAARLELEEQAVADQLLETFFARTGATPMAPSFVRARLWRVARTVVPLGEPCLFDAALRLGVCGDFCIGDGVEAAFLSGAAVAGRLNALPPGVLSEESPARSSSQMRLL